MLTRDSLLQLIENLLESLYKTETVSLDHRPTYIHWVKSLKVARGIVERCMNTGISKELLETTNNRRV